MGWNVCARLENREEGGGPASWHIALGRILEQFGRTRAPGQVRGLGDTLIPQEIGAPATRLVELLPLIERHTVFGVRDVGFKSGPIGYEHRGELRADVICGSFDRIQPRKFRTLEKLQRRDFREVHEGRFGVVAFAPAGDDLDASVYSPILFI